MNPWYSLGTSHGILLPFFASRTFKTQWAHPFLKCSEMLHLRERDLWWTKIPAPRRILQCSTRSGSSNWIHLLARSRSSLSLSLYSCVHCTSGWQSHTVIRGQIYSLTLLTHYFSTFQIKTHNLFIKCCALNHWATISTWATICCSRKTNGMAKSWKSCEKIKSEILFQHSRIRP